MWWTSDDSTAVQIEGMCKCGVYEKNVYLLNLIRLQEKASMEVVRSCGFEDMWRLLLFFLTLIIPNPINSFVNCATTWGVYQLTGPCNLIYIRKKSSEVSDYQT